MLNCNVSFNSEQTKTILEYIKPLVHSIYKTKLDGWILVLDNKVIIINKELSIIYEVNIINTGIIFCCSILDLFIEDLNWDCNKYADWYHATFIINKYNQYLGYKDELIHTMNITSDSSFEEYTKLKSKEGKKGYIIESVYIPIFYGLLPIAKSDSVDLFVYNIYNSCDKLVKYIIHKKKIKSDIIIYTRVMGQLIGNGY